MRWFGLIGVFAAFAAFGVFAAEPAKKMYRCGNVFQERPCEGPKPAPAAVDVPKQQAGPSQATLESRKKIRCDNFQRQVTELVDRERVTKDADLLRGLVGQRKVLEDRMKSDSC
jgi:hypothetical protein